MFANVVRAILFPAVGTDDTVVAVFPDGVTEGSTTTGRGYAMRGNIDTFNLGGTVGTLLDVTFSVESRGIEA